MTKHTLKSLADELRSDGDTYELNDTQTLRLRIEQDGGINPFEEADCYGRVEWARGRERPADFDGNAEIVYRDGHGGTAWWQPPADIKRSHDGFPKFRELIKHLLEFGYSAVTVELLEGTDAYGQAIVTKCASLGGIDSLDGGYLTEVVSNLIDELELLDPDLCSQCQDRPAMDEGSYSGLCRDCGHQAFKEDEADRKRDDY